MNIHEILYTKWGFKAFRPLQEDIINSIVSGKNTLALLPTGGGKSICYQVPALLKPGLCIVISPLVALMKDQVDRLTSMNIKAISIHAGMSYRAIDIALDNCIYGDIKFLYVSPERLQTELFQARVPQMNINLIAVDEAHCISQWGYDFRPSYLKIPEAFAELKNVPILALTATANERVQHDIVEKLEIADNNAFKASFKRENLSFIVRKPENKKQKLLEAITKMKGSCIVYSRSRQGVTDMASWLKSMGVSADYYHAGLDMETRNTKQQQWISGNTQVIVSTNAFGMGIDKANVRLVAHFDLPNNLESYYQEAGRAGRDGRPAYALLLCNDADEKNFEGNIDDVFPTINEVKNYYNAIGNYLQVAVNNGAGQAFPFDVVDFADTFKLPVKKAIQVVQLLEQQGVFALSDSVYAPSTLKVLLNKADLYAFQISNRKFDGLLQVLLRKYSGVFEEPVTIKEKDIAKLIKQSFAEVVNSLNYLAQLKVLEYERTNRNSILTYIENRVNIDRLDIDHQFLQSRKAILIAERSNMLGYTRNNNLCRSMYICNYFDDKTAGPCGICDICVEQDFKGKLQTVKAIVLRLVKEKNYTTEELILNCPNYRTEHIIAAIRALMEAKLVIQVESGTFAIVK